MRRSTLARPLAWAAIATLALACGDDPTAPAPVAGQLRISLATPAGAESGLVLTIAGPSLPGPATLHAAAPDALIFARATAGTLRVAVFGPLRAGHLLRVPVPDVGAADRYSATLVEVAAPDYSLRELAGYTVTVAPE